MIPKGSSGAAAALPLSLVSEIEGFEGAPKLGHVWANFGDGTTAELMLRLPGTTAYTRATISRIVELGAGDYEYRPHMTETAALGVISWHPNVAGYDTTVRWDRITETAVPPSIHSGAAQAGGASSITLAASAQPTDGLYVDAVIRITGGAGEGQTNQITAYTGLTKFAAVARPWAVVPDSSSTYELLAAASARAAASMTVEGLNVEGSNTLGDLVRGLVALVAGKSEGWDAIRANGGNGDAVYYAMNGATARMTVTYSTDGRPAITINTLES